ncbi:ribonuclease BN (tRNA processing enzyme) [Bacillus oleivorans]|uniref:Ribonuclease BN (tRNA processing enzyme) n=1 Tax=Bacillus oleivorans TaxID=1448271 RepID=A0A285CR77_9BACI|nr:MBL fold metallo-hydrolase [Bacillus oleivorans]SNX70031.1 ribonuclease BN (tRNA processing enzyme) [Bacillus oleivorans]
MELTVVGFRGGYPGKDEATSGYILEENGFRLLMDCGSAVISHLQRYIQPEELDAVIVSHYHADHVADIGILQHARLIQSFLGKQMPNLPIYGHQEDMAEFQELTYKQITKGIAYDPNSKLQVGPFSITFLRTNHPVSCFAMRIEAGGKALVYTADTSFKEEFIDFSKAANLLVCECNLYKGQDGKAAGHMTSEEAGNLAAKAGVGSLILTHLPHYGDVSQLVQEAKENYNGPVALAHSGLQVTL